MLLTFGSMSVFYIFKMEIKSVKIGKIPGMEYKQYFKQIIVSHIRSITTPNGEKN